MNNKMNTIFLHVALMGHGEEIANEILTHVKSSGLLKNSTKLYVSVVGYGKLNLNITKNIEIIYHNIPVTEFEYPTLKLMEDYALCNKTNMLYLTCLGTTGRTKDRENKRKYIHYFLIDKWKDCVNALNRGYDCVGVDYRQKPVPHFGGFHW